MTNVQSLWFDPTTCLIDGQWNAAASGKTLTLVNPSDGSDICQIARGGKADIDAAVQAADAALNGDWGRMTALERGRILTRIGQLVLERVDDLAALEAMDVGKPLTQARADAVALARYMSSMAARRTRCMAKPSLIWTAIPFTRFANRMV